MLQYDSFTMAVTYFLSMAKFKTLFKLALFAGGDEICRTLFPPPLL